MQRLTILLQGHRLKSETSLVAKTLSNFSVHISSAFVLSGSFHTLPSGMHACH